MSFFCVILRRKGLIYLSPHRGRNQRSSLTDVKQDDKLRIYKSVPLPEIAYRNADEWKNFNSILPIATPTVIEDIREDSDKLIKILHDGQIYLRRGVGDRDVKVYTITGQEVR